VRAVEDEALEHGAVGRPCPRAGDGRKQKREQDRDGEREAHGHHLVVE